MELTPQNIFYNESNNFKIIVPMIRSIYCEKSNVVTTLPLPAT